ncbi:hypothetical protein S2E19_06028 [Bacillus mycoides]|uniref:Uncharacterized protein n=1 Tax=Bacillus mycoides TaxID=1405 RepID=A0AAP8KUF0_BACMY|nr:hypothetical protein [Bacillus mycoides]MED1042631.1 hypothetical protein [Bacillus mycoides]OSY06763.1 hypothetical protein S2E19_06028 [Bacillus mycoides]PJN57679.1 hypothetical protein BAWEI_54470 [Bacillus mycoides]PJN70477.1 hypothetical protein BACWE_26570 [Bacillus mycoides]
MNKSSYSFTDYVNAIIWLLLPCAFIFGLAYPTFLLIFILFLSILLSYYGFTMKSLLNTYGLDSGLMIPIYRLFAFLLSPMFFSIFIVLIPSHKIAFLSLLTIKYGEELYYLLIMYMISTLLFSLFEILFYLYKNIKDPKNITNGFERLTFSIHLFIAILTTFILPDIFFGALYTFTFINYDDTMDVKSLFEFSYFSFLIHYALPINSDSIQYYVRLLNEHTLSRVIQVVHIITCKFLDLTFLAVLIQYFLGFINTFNTENKNNKGS